VAEKASSQALLPEVMNCLSKASVILHTNPRWTSAIRRGKCPRPPAAQVANGLSMKLEFMRASTLLQRNFAGLFSPVQAPISRQSCLISRAQSFASQSARFLHIDSKAEAELKELFKRAPWPTTPQEERALVESVRTVIWEGPNGGMLIGV
jgi:hypothetical protein